jgi:N-methylhydantoinase B/oxoprolinase/acetone carboxylase alpha subunit
MTEYIDNIQEAWERVHLNEAKIQTTTIDKGTEAKVAAGLKKVAKNLRISAKEEGDDSLLKAAKEVENAAKEAKTGKIKLTPQVTDALEQAGFGKFAGASYRTNEGKLSSKFDINGIIETLRKANF